MYSIKLTNVRVWDRICCPLRERQQASVLFAMCRPSGFCAYVATAAILIFLSTVADSNACPAKQDLTLTPEAKGREVVEAAVKKIQESGIFPDDNGFLRRIAYVESRDGEHPDTFREGYHGGIWQVDKGGFAATQDTNSHRKLKRRFDEIQEKFGLDWTTVRYEKLREPLYSALAARLYLVTKEPPIPLSSEIEKQAQYWKDHYNTPAGAGTVQDFIDRVKELNDKMKQG